MSLSAAKGLALPALPLPMGAAAHPPTGQALAQGVSPGWLPPDPPTTCANRFAMATQSDP